VLDDARLVGRELDGTHAAMQIKTTCSVIPALLIRGAAETTAESIYSIAREATPATPTPDLCGGLAA
jgi:hypothetical protein